jgi:hypothetical protein
MKQTTRTKGYDRKDGTHVRGYTQERQTWKDARSSGSIAAGSALIALFLFLEFGFTLISTIAIVLMAALSAIAGGQTIYAIAPNRTRPRRRSARSGSRSRSRRRKARWRTRRRKAGKWARQKGESWAMAGARAAGRAWRRANGRPQGWDPSKRASGSRSSRGRR